MDETTTTNQFLWSQDIFNPEFDKQPKIVIVGAGWIGCGTTFALAQLGFKDITVIDFDEVELKNTSSQLYKQEDIGKMKVQALHDNVLAFTWTDIQVFNDKFKPEYVKDADIVIAAVDVMSVRKEILEACTIKTKRFIDCRMASNYFHIYNYIPVYENILYLQTWYPDNEASPETCTNKSSSFNTFVIAWFICRFIVWITKDEEFILKKTQLTVDLKNLLISW